MRKIIGVFLIAALLFLPNVFAEELSDTFKSVTKDGKFIVNSVPPLEGDEPYVYLIEGNIQRQGEEDIEYYYDTTNGTIGVKMETCNATYTKCTFVRYDSMHNEVESHELDIVYNYDEDINNDLGEMLANVADSYEVIDLEVINAWLNEGVSLINFSGDFKHDIGYKNFSIVVAAGAEEPLLTARMGMARFEYNGISYRNIGFLAAEMAHLIYVPTDTEDDDILATAQARIDNYVGSGKVILSEASIDDAIEEYADSWTAFDAENHTGITHADRVNEATSYFNDTLASYGSAKLYKATIGSKSYYLGITKDDNGMYDPEYVTSDIATNVTVVSEDGNVPLDALVDVKVLTEGELYDKIQSIVNPEDGETYDISLFSSSKNGYVTKLDNGEFQVWIPISDELLGKELKVYYVNEDGTVEEHEVTVEGDYAVFTTNHFSAYTLASGANIVAPNTLDNVTVYFVIGFISIIGLLGGAIYLNKCRG